MYSYNIISVCCKCPHAVAVADIFTPPFQPAQGLNLTAIEPGPYLQLCLAVKYGGSDGAPARCLLAPM